LPKTAGGLLLFRFRAPGKPEVLLVHLGGPFWQNKDAGAWSIPKGEPSPDEDLLATARREFEEETGMRPKGTPFPLGQVKQAGGKLVHAWALQGDFDVTTLKSNTFSVEWPKGSGHLRSYPEVDRAQWFGLTEARERLLPAQVPFLDVLQAAPQFEAARKAGLP